MKHTIVERLESRRLLAAAVTDSSGPSELFDAGGTLYFSADDGVHGDELFKSDGSSGGTVLVKDIVSGGVGSKPSDFVSFGGATYFLTSNEFLDPQLWKTDGTAAGTQLVQDLRTIAGQEVSATQLVNANGSLFIATSSRTDFHALIKSDGTAGGTVKVKAFSGLHFVILGGVNGTILLNANDPINGSELWKTDGTSAGTLLVKDINPGVAGSSPGEAFEPHIAVLNNVMYFGAFANGIQQLWKSDGTTSGTTAVKDVAPVNQFAVFNNAVYFSANGSGSSASLWKSDGTSAGTVQLSEFGFFGATTPVMFGQALYYTANDFIHGYELWKTDGTVGGTLMVKDISPNLGSVPRALTVFNGAIYFSAGGGNQFSSPTGVGDELWKSDGTAAGTVLVKDINPGPDNSVPGLGRMVVSNNKLFLPATDGTHGFELWGSDGTAAGTTLVKDLNATDPSFQTLRYIQEFGTTRIITGTDGDDVFTFTISGDFYVVSRNGKNETFPRSENFFLLETNDGDDIVDASAISFHTIIHGGEGNDSITAGSGNDTLAGVGGNDTLFGGDGNDRVDGGGGNDSVWGNNGNDTLLGQDGVDSLYGNGGSDRLEGGANSDHMRGNGGRDMMFGNGGNDRIYGGASADRIYGGPGNDQLFGEGGNDRLYSDDGDSETLSGGAGDDVFITLDSVIDHLFGDSGHDSAVTDDNDVLTSVESRINE